MWQIKPDEKSQHGLKYIEALSQEHIKLLKRLAYCAKSGGELDSNSTRHLFDLLRTVKLKQEWIACDCHNDKPSVMTVCHRNQSLYLRRVASFPEHDQACIFYRESVENTSQATRKKPKASSLFSLYRESSEVAAPKVSLSISGSSGGQSLPKLARRLFQLLDMAGLLQVTSDYREIKAQYGALKKVTESLQLTPKNRLCHYFWTHPAQVGYAGMYLKKTKYTWPKEHSPHGFLLVVAEKIDGDTLLCKYGGKTYEIKTQNPVKLSSGRLGGISAPYLVFMSIASLGASAGFYPLDAYAIPVYSPFLLMPVESHYERLFLKKLLSLSASLKKRGINSVIEKPMFDISVGENEACRPDFIIKANNKTLVLEVMGSHEEDYLERKARTHPLMEKLGPLLEFDALKATNNKSWDEDFTKIAKIIYAQLLMTK